MPVTGRRIALVLLAALVLSQAPTLADTPATSGQPDPLLVLPPPPPEGSPRARAELAELKHFQATRTPEQFAAARYDNDNENAKIFATVLGPAWDLQKLPATARLLDMLAAAEDKASGIAKKEFHRNRPWIVSPSIRTCAPHKPGPAANSYPSGHATIGYAMGIVLAQLMPAHAQAILARSESFAENRLVCGFHFRSDIVAGQQFGTLLALTLMQNAEFQSDMAAAQAELHAANFIP